MPRSRAKRKEAAKKVRFPDGTYGTHDNSEGCSHAVVYFSNRDGRWKVLNAYLGLERAVAAYHSTVRASRMEASIALHTVYVVDLTTGIASSPAEEEP
jgi:hypothetical protein